MNVNLLTCASSDKEVAWHGINWANCHQQVRRLQARIVKATREGRQGKVKALQWLLTRSFSAKAIAIKRVTENQGKRTPGVDGETWPTPEAKSQALLLLRRRGYKPLPLRRVYIPKASGKLRPLGIPTMRDRAMQALYLLALQPIAETLADPNSYGFRPARSTADAQEQCHTLLSRWFSPQWILEGDIKACYDNISHSWMLAYILMDKQVLQRWLKAGFIERGRLFPTEAGTPQGGIISPTLATMTLTGLERELEAKFGRKRTKQSSKNKVHWVIYADDFIVTAASKELLVNEVMPLLERFLASRGLELSREKTRITHIDEGFDFLGWNVRKYNGKLLIKPSKRNTKAFLDKLRQIVKANKATSQVNLIRLLNPVIRGWANYHRMVAAKKTFAKVDNEIWHLLWRWAKRRHHSKGKRWIKNRYFKSIGNRNGVFMADTGKCYPDGKPIWLKLARASETRIRRHVKIKGAANPFDPQWETYFEDRLGLKMKEDLTGRKVLLTLWKDQEGNCPLCYQKITKETGWNIHHIRPKSEGGEDNVANLVLLHPNCHRQIHSRRLKVCSRFSQETLAEA